MLHRCTSETFGNCGISDDSMNIVEVMVKCCKFHDSLSGRLSALLLKEGSIVVEL